MNIFKTNLFMYFFFQKRNYFGFKLNQISYTNTSVWFPEFSESVDRRSIHQLVATCKTNKKTTVVFRRPSDGKVILFSEDLELRAAVILIKNLVPHLV